MQVQAISLVEKALPWGDYVRVFCIYLLNGWLQDKNTYEHKFLLQNFK